MHMSFVLKDSENQVVLGNSTKQHQGGPKRFKKWSKHEIYDDFLYFFFN